MVTVTDWNNRRITYKSSWINGATEGQDMT